MATLQSKLPWAAHPLLINAPMGGAAGGALASAVSLAGGVGIIGALANMSDLRKELLIATEAFSSHATLSLSETLPLGVGLIPFLLNIQNVVPVVAEFKPAFIWLFAAKDTDTYAQWAIALRAASPKTAIWIQTGSVSSALHIARSVSPDVLCVQGVDAGGHGFEKSASIISLLPETLDAMARNGFSHIHLVAAGGIADGRGVAAALALGAQGVVMGTRFLASKEIMLHPNYQAAVLEAQDGGQVTTRSKAFDELGGPTIWPEVYDGRSLVVKSYRDLKDGVALEEIQKLHNEAVKQEDKGFQTGLQGRAAIWVGTGVGLVSEVQNAREIVESVRREAKEILVKVARL